METLMETAMTCPKCQGAMEAVSFEGVQVDRCTGCKGLWFDAFEHEQLKGMPGSESIDTGVGSVAPAAAGPVDCPKCRVAMIRMVANGQPHIGYESCGVCHGVYFDAGEFADYRDDGLFERVRRALAR